MKYILFRLLLEKLKEQIEQINEEHEEEVRTLRNQLTQANKEIMDYKTKPKPNPVPQVIVQKPQTPAFDPSTNDKVISISAHQKTVDVLKSKVHECKKKIEALQKSQSSSEKEIISSRENVSGLERELSLIKAENESLKAQLSNSEEDRKNLHQQCLKLIAKPTEQPAQKKKSHVDSAKIFRQEAEIDYLKKQIDQIRSMEELKSRQLAESQSKVKTLECKIADAADATYVNAAAVKTFLTCLTSSS